MVSGLCVTQNLMLGGDRVNTGLLSLWILWFSGEDIKNEDHNKTYDSYERIEYLKQA